MITSPPWGPRAAVQVIVAQLLCLAGITAVAEVTAGQASVHDQAGWLSVATVAAIASGAFNTVWLVGARRATARRRQLLLADFDTAALAARADAAVVVPDEGLVAIPGMTLVHRASCPLVTGRSVEAASGGEPCGWCRP